MADTLKPGTEQDGYRFIGGDPSNPRSWEPVNGIKAGTIEDGFQFLGGDPSDQSNWKKAPGLGENIKDVGNAVVEGAQKTYRSARAALGTYVGANQDVVDQAKKTGEIEQKSDADALKSLKEDIQRRKLQGDEGLIAGVRNVAGAVANNPAGGVQLVAEQAPNSAISLGAGVLGAKGGATAGGAIGTLIAPGPGTAIGATVGGIGGFLAGLFGANTLLETGGKAIEAAQDGQFTDAERSQAIKEGATKGAVITGVDAATLGASKFILGSASRAVESATLRTLTDAGIDATKAAASIRTAQQAAVDAAAKSGEKATAESIQKATLDAMAKEGLLDPALRASVESAQKAAFDTATTAGKRAGRGAAAMGLETLGEGVGEAAGEYAATGTFSPTDAVLEGISGMGMSVGELYVAKKLDNPGQLTQAYASQRRAEAEANLGQAQTIDQAITAADDLASSVNDLEQAIGQWNGATPLDTGTIPTPAAAAAGVQPLATGPNIQQLQTRVDREAELLAQANGEPVGNQPALLRQQAARLEAQAATFNPDDAAPNGQPSRAQALLDQAANLRKQADQVENRTRASGAGFEADRQNALAQIEATRTEPKPRVAADFVDLTPMDPRQAQARLAVLRDETAQAGGNALGLAAVAHPSQPGKFAIAQQPLPSLDLGPAPAPTVTPEAAQNRIESAALAGKVEGAKAEDRNSRQVVIDRALRSVEERGGVASPAEAKIFQEAGLGKPYDRIDETLAGELTTDQKLTQATGIALDKAPRSEMTQQTGPTDQQLQQQENNDRSDSRLQQLAADRAAKQNAAATDTRAATQAPNVDSVVAALRVPGTQRTAEQNLTIRQAQDRMAPADFKIAQTAASGPFNLDAEQRVRLRELRNPQSVVSAQQTAAAPVAQETPGLLGERVARALGVPSNGTVVTTNAKFSSTRTPAPGMTDTVTDTETDENGQTREVQHQFSVVDPSKLGSQGKLLQQIARIFGKRLVVFNSPTLKADGFVRDGDNRNIYINAESGISPLAVFGHELLHILKREAPQAYAALETVVKRNLSEEGKADFDKYYGSGANLEELTADLMGNQFQSTEFWADVFSEIAKQNPEGARATVLKVAAALNRAINAFMKLVQQGQYKSDQFVTDLEAIKAAVKEATVTYAQQQRDASIALDREEQGAQQAPGQKVTASPVRPAGAATEDLDRSLGDQRVSPRNPTGVKSTESPLEPYRLQPDLANAKKDAGSFAHNIGLMAQYPNFEGLQGDTDQKVEGMLDQMVSNLMWLFNHWKPELRARSRMWYVGGNRIAHRWADRFNTTPERVAAVIAATSPQKDWFQNVSLAERILEAVVNNPDTAWDEKMSRTVRERDWGGKLSKDLKYAPINEIPRLQGKTLRQLYDPNNPASLLDMSVWIRAWDEANNPMMARVITPEGAFAKDFDAGKNGKPIGLRWQSFSTIAKTLQILQAPDRATMSSIIGANHKVRSFFNNIIAPFDDEDVTIDTHAVAAALLRPLGSSSVEVAHNFGTNEKGQPGPKNSTLTGLYGTYAIYAEAYRRAAKEAGVLPREMQSITWEAVRGLFRPEQKNERIKGESDAIWRQVAAGERDENDAREAVSRLVGGIVDPAWVRFPVGTHEAAQDSSYQSGVPEAGVPGGGTRSSPRRDSGKPAKKPEVAAKPRAFEEIPVTELAGRSVSLPVKVEETGETATLTLDAKDALDDINERESALQRLLECLGK